MKIKIKWPRCKYMRLLISNLGLDSFYGKNLFLVSFFKASLVFFTCEVQLCLCAMRIFVFGLLFCVFMRISDSVCFSKASLVPVFCKQYLNVFMQVSAARSVAIIMARISKVSFLRLYEIRRLNMFVTGFQVGGEEWYVGA